MPDVNLDVVLVASCPNQSDPTGSRCLVVQNGPKHNFPWATLLKDKDLAGVASYLAGRTLGLKDQFTTIHFVGLRDNPSRLNGNRRQVSAVYALFVPETVQPVAKDCQWVRVNDLRLDEDQTAILQMAACRRF